jgi:hypothetical protein
VVRKLVVTRRFSALTLVSDRESANNRRTARAERHLRITDDNDAQDLRTQTGTTRDTRPGDRIASAPKRARRQRKFMQKPRVPDEFRHRRQVYATSPTTPQLIDAENGVGGTPASRARALRRARLLSPAGGMRAGVLTAFWIVAEMSAH